MARSKLRTTESFGGPFRPHKGCRPAWRSIAINCQKCFAIEAPTRPTPPLRLSHFRPGGTCQTRAQGKAHSPICFLFLLRPHPHIRTGYPHLWGRKAASGLPRRKRASFARHWQQSRVSIQFTQSFRVNLRKGSLGTPNLHPALTSLSGSLYYASGSSGISPPSFLSTETHEFHGNKPLYAIVRRTGC